MDDLRILHEKFLKIISEHFIDNPIYQHEIIKKLGIKSTAELREYVIRPLRIEGIPIASGDKGVFLACKAEQLDGTIGHLSSRRNSYHQTIKGLELAKVRLKVGHNPLDRQGKLL